MFWLSIAGSVVLVISLARNLKELMAAAGWNKLIVLGPVFFAAAMAVFGAEHLVLARSLMQVVPVWMPARLFWVYFVGIAELAAALSLAVGKWVRWSALSLAVMFLLFVLTIHLPNVVARPADRFLWAVLLRDTTFGAGAFSLAVARSRHPHSPRSQAMIRTARLAVAVPIIVFGIEHLLHPRFAPGVPLPKLTPAWVFLPQLLGYLAGSVLLAGGAAMLFHRRSRLGALAVGALMTILTVCLYLPILLMDDPTQRLEGMNYVADTLLFGGAVLLVAGASPEP
jgi:uncharacterized membrane protein